MNLEELKDEEISKIVKTGDKDAFGVLVDRYSTKLNRYISRFVFNADERDDLLQNVFIKAYININSFNDSRSFSPWIYRITHNEIVNYIRKGKKEVFGIVDWDVLLPIDLYHNNWGEEINKEQIMEHLEEVIQSIPAKYREAISLFYLEEKNYIEISEILKIPISTVGVRLGRAKKLIKKIYLSKYHV